MFPWYALATGMFEPARTPPCEPQDKHKEDRARPLSGTLRLALLAIAAAILLTLLYPARASAQSLTPQQYARAVSPTPADVLHLVGRVHLGVFTCEGGISATLVDLPGAPGKFVMSVNGATLLFEAVATRTGAMRLEEKATGLVWLQLPSKSMLLDQQAGKRLVDECTNVDQKHFASTQRLPTLFD